MTVSEVITQSEELKRQCEAAREKLVATRIASHRLMCAGRVYKIAGRICVQSA